MSSLTPEQEWMTAEDFGLIGIAEVSDAGVRLQIEGINGKELDGTFWIPKSVIMNWDSIAEEMKLVSFLDADGLMPARPQARYFVPAMVDSLILKRWWCEKNGLPVGDAD